MRFAGGATFFAATLVTVLACACSGSSSESPWPVEPAVSPLGPEGEQPNEESAARKAKRRPVEDEAYGGTGGGRSAPARPVNLEESGAVP